ncbi:MAG TPA: IPT/TIG domain-containing protein, partial [Gemmatimonadaceae bacterium]|nr:IPT/TIG domain-containing protein [Gemmatimonadaceae bacterium]
MHHAILKTARSSIAYCGLAGLGLLGTSCGGGGDSTAPPPQVGNLSISPTSPAQVSAGGTLQLSVTVRDTKGAVMSGQSITYTTSAPSIATVSNQGVVSAPGPVGAADITASAGGVSASLSLTVVPGASASVTRTSADPANVSAGAPAGDSVRFVVKDAFGNPRANEVVLFAVAAGNGQVSPAVAQTDAQGRVATRFRTGITVGPNTVTATVNGVAPASLALTTVASSVSITSVTPSPMVPGAAVTINGSGFSATSTEDVVTVDGLTATITTASSTQITFVAPASPCAPTHQANLELVVNGASGFARPTLRPGTLRTIPVGSAILIRDAADLGCTELSPAGAQYTVSVLNTSQSLSALTPFRFTGTTTIPASASIAVNPFVLHQSVNVGVPHRPATAIEAAARDRALAHRGVLEANRAIYRRFKNRIRSRRGAAANVSPSVRASVSVPSSVSAAVAIGDTRLFRVVRIAGTSVSCSIFDEITARAVYVGTKGIIWEDVAAPLHGQMDAHLVRLGEEFDATMYVTDSTYFGDPLVTDGDTDQDQHLNMIFTPVVPTGIAGFVILCDFFPRNTTDNQGSNLGETFYAAVPTVAGSGFTGNTADNWIRRMRSIIVHEVKHIASDGAHLEQQASDLEESWLEEGMAMTAEEVWGRNSVYHTTWKGNADYRSTL